MKTFRFTFCILSALALSACSNTLAGIKADARGPNDPRPALTTSAAWAGLKTDAQDISDWAHGRPSALQETLGGDPEGYAVENNRNKTPQWQVPGMAAADSPAREFHSEPVAKVKMRPLVWEEIGDAPAELPVKKMKELSSVSVNNGDVTVYPVDAADTDAAESRSELFPPAGKMVQQIFFDYGSAKVGAEDRGELRSLAGDIRTAGGYALTIVGHASRRVDHVDDPLRRKLINFKMASRRAAAVTWELRKAGVKPDSVTATSEGDVAPNPDPHGKDQEAADRRVEVYVDNK